MKMKRPGHNHLPVVVDPESDLVKNMYWYKDTFPLRIFATLAFSSFAMFQFSKAYFPYGLILRRSIPTTPWQQFTYRAPVGLLFFGLWWIVREGPRRGRIDLTCDSEN